MINLFLNKKLNLKNDLILTVMNGLIVFLGVFLLNGYISRNLGLDYLGEYLLVRRVVLSAVGIVLVGLNISIPTLIAKNIKHVADSAFILFVGISLPLIILFTTLIQNNVLGEFPNIDFFSYSIFIIGICSQFIVYGLYRGHMNMIGANMIQFSSTALIPLIIFFLEPDLNDAFRNMGLLLTISNMIFFFIKNGKLKITHLFIKRTFQVLKFGIVRIPSIIAQFILLAIVPIMISKNGNFSDVAYYTSSLALLRSSLIIVGPIGIILLPRVAKAIASGQKFKVKAGIEVLIEMVVIFSLLASISLSIFGGEILELWLGEVSSTGVWIVKTLLLFMPFYLFIDILRSPIDAMSEKGINSVIYSLAALVLILIYYLMIRLGYSEIRAGVISFGCAYLAASILAYVAVRNVLRITLPSRLFFTICITCVGILLFSHQTLKYFIESNLMVSILYFTILLITTFVVAKIFFKRWKYKIIR